MRKNDALLLTYFVGKSTAFVIPVLPIYLLHHGGFSIQYMLHVASFYVLVPVILDIPLGLLADRIGYKPVLILGTSLFLIGFIGIAYINQYSYHIYILGISLAAACYSGSEPLFIKSLLSHEQRFSIYFAKLNESMYIITAAFLIAGGASYQLSPILPIGIQIFCLITALISLLLLPAATIPVEKQACRKSNKRRRGCPPTSLLVLLAVVILCNGLYTGITQLNSRTVQIQLDDLLTGINGIAIGCVFAFGNLASSWGSKFFRAKFANWNSSIPLTFSTLLAGFSCVLFVPKSLAFVIIAFFMFSFFKGFYRPAINSALVEATGPFERHATAYSAANVASVAIAAIIHYAAASTFYDLSYLYELASLILGASLLAPFCLWIAERNRLVEVFGQGFSSKRHFIKYRSNSPSAYVQKYSAEDTNGKRLDEIYANMCAGYLPAPQCSIEAGSLKMEYISGPRLTKCETEQQLDIVSHLLSRVKRSADAGKGVSIVPELHEVFSPETLTVLGKEGLLRPSMIHGDLHPDNILVLANQPVVVDWDHSGTGIRVFDVLTLITSPMLNIPRATRIEIIEQTLGLSAPKSAVIFDEFAKFKYGQLRAFDVPELEAVAQGYLDLQATG